MKVNTENIRIFIKPREYQKMLIWTQLAKGEVSGLGLIKEADEGFLIDEVFLLEQQCSSAGTELEEKSVCALMLELEKKGLELRELRFWWHTHGDMKVFWSSTDNQCIEGLANSGFFISMVLNKEEKKLLRMDIFKPLRACFDELDLEFYLEEELELELFCQKEFQDKVKESLVRYAPFERDFFPDIPCNMVEEAFERGEITAEEYQEQLETLGYEFDYD